MSFNSACKIYIKKLTTLSITSDKFLGISGKAMCKAPQNTKLLVIYKILL